MWNPKVWINESKKIVLDAMDEYANEKLRSYRLSISLHNKFKNKIKR